MDMLLILRLERSSKTRADAEVMPEHIEQRLPARSIDMLRTLDYDVAVGMGPQYPGFKDAEVGRRFLRVLDLRLVRSHQARLQLQRTFGDARGLDAD